MYLLSTLMAAEVQDLAADGGKFLDAVENCTKWLTENHFLLKKSGNF